MAEKKNNQISSEELMERFKNLPLEIQATYVSAELVLKSEEAMHKASMEMNDRMEELEKMPTKERNKLMSKIMDKYFYPQETL